MNVTAAFSPNLRHTYRTPTLIRIISRFPTSPHHVIQQPRMARTLTVFARSHPVINNILSRRTTANNHDLRTSRRITITIHTPSRSRTSQHPPHRPSRLHKHTATSNRVTHLSPSIPMQASRRKVQSAHPRINRRITPILVTTTRRRCQPTPDQRQDQHTLNRRTLIMTRHREISNATTNQSRVLRVHDPENRSVIPLERHLRRPSHARKEVPQIINQRVHRTDTNQPRHPRYLTPRQKRSNHSRSICQLTTRYQSRRTNRIHRTQKPTITRAPK